jgi:hypothetical protein
MPRITVDAQWKRVRRSWGGGPGINGVVAIAANWGRKGMCIRWISRAQGGVILNLFREEFLADFVPYVGPPRKLP